MNDPALFRYREAAAYLAISEPMVKRLVSQGKLRRVKIGRAARIPRTELDWFIARRLPKRERAPEVIPIAQ